MKKAKVILIICIVIAVLLLIVPIPQTLKDGGTIYLSPLTLTFPGFESLCPSQKRTKQSLRSFFIQSEGLVCNLTAGEYGIAVGVWHHAPPYITS